MDRKMSIILMLFGVFNFLHAQSVEFQLQRLSPCDSLPIPEDQHYFLTDVPYKVTDETYDNSGSNVVIVPKPGKYLLHRYTEPDIKPYEIELKLGRNVETVYDSKIIFRCSATVEPYFFYEVCGNLAEGYQEDFYPNGKIRIRGNFKEGNALDSIAEYYENGNRSRILFYKRKGVFFTEYDSLGKKKHFRWSESRDCLISYCSFKEVWYGVDEMPVYEFSNMNHVIEIKEHYLSGSLKLLQKKKYRVEYYQNGNIENKFTWKTKRKSGEYVHGIVHQQFDVNGKLIAENFEEDRSYYPQPSIAHSYDNPFYE